MNPPICPCSSSAPARHSDTCPHPCPCFLLPFCFTRLPLALNFSLCHLPALPIYCPCLRGRRLQNSSTSPVQKRESGRTRLRASARDSESSSAMCRETHLRTFLSAVIKSPKDGAGYLPMKCSPKRNSWKASSSSFHEEGIATNHHSPLPLLLILHFACLLLDPCKIILRLPFVALELFILRVAWVWTCKATDH